MPKRSWGDPMNPWAYTVMAGLQVPRQDDSEQLGAPIIGRGIPVPDSAFEAPTPVSDENNSGPWWLTQTLSAAEASKVSVIFGLSKFFSLIPVVPADYLLHESDLEVVATRELDMPLLRRDDPTDLLFRHTIREALHQLAVAQRADIEHAFRACANLLNQRSAGQRIRSGHRFRLALVTCDFELLPSRKPTRDTRAVILIDQELFHR